MKCLSLVVIAVVVCTAYSTVFALCEGCVTAEGVSARGNPAMARDEAVEDALRNAVEQAVGTFLDSRSTVTGMDELEEQIYSHSVGFVEHYVIEREWSQGGLYHVRIRAKVRRDRLRASLEATGILLRRVNLPRIMFLVGEKDSSYGTVRTRVVEAKLAALFGKRGARVVDNNVVQFKLDRAKAVLALGGDLKAARAIGNQAGAELVVTGRAVSSVSGSIRGSALKACHGVVNLKAIRVDTGEVIGSASGSANAAHVDRTVGADQALGRAAEKAGLSLLASIVDQWNATVNSGRTVEMTVSGLENYRLLTGLKGRILAGIRGVKAVYIREYDQAGGIGVLEVEMLGTAYDLADRLDGNSIGDGTMAVLHITGNRVDFMLE